MRNPVRAFENQRPIIFDEFVHTQSKIVLMSQKFDGGKPGVSVAQKKPYVFVGWTGSSIALDWS